MSRYLLLFLLNFPFILAAILGALTQYKLGKSSKRRFIAQTILWLVILTGLLIAQPLYEWLYSNELTQTEPLSLFDVIQITAIVVTFCIANRTRAQLESTERRLQDLHQELSIRLSSK
jgi:hypothetical protein